MHEAASVSFYLTPGNVNRFQPYSTNSQTRYWQIGLLQLSLEANEKNICHVIEDSPNRRADFMMLNASNEANLFILNLIPMELAFEFYSNHQLQLVQCWPAFT